MTERSKAAAFRQCWEMQPVGVVHQVELAYGTRKSSRGVLAMWSQRCSGTVSISRSDSSARSRPAKSGLPGPLLMPRQSAPLPFLGAAGNTDAAGILHEFPCHVINHICKNPWIEF
jgi:hypothetical protein